MPSSYSFLQSNSSSSSSENDSKSDQSDDDDSHVNRIRHSFKKRTIQNDNYMLERPSDSDNDNESVSEADDDEHDIQAPSTIPESYLLPRQSSAATHSIDENKSHKFEHNDSLFIDSDSSPFVRMHDCKTEKERKKTHQTT